MAESKTANSNTMTPELWQQVESEFSKLVDLPESELASVLSALKSRSPRVAAEVASLLQHDASDAKRDWNRLVPPIDLDAGLQGKGQARPESERKIGDRVGGYKLMEYVSGSRHSEVWRAVEAGSEDRQTTGSQKRVAEGRELSVTSQVGSFALKFLKDCDVREQDSKRFKRFRNEVLFLGQMRHPNIVELVDVGCDETSPFFVMQFVAGLSITDHAEQQRVDLVGRLEMLLRLCDAVEYAHRSSLVHRDLKPSNVIVNSAGEPVVLDFGISKYIDESGGDLAGKSAEWQLTATQERPMTPAYASPEQLRGEAVTRQTDIYALGLIAYELIARSHPYSDLAQPVALPLFDRICNQVPKPPSALFRKENLEGGKRNGVEYLAASRMAQRHLDDAVLTALAKSPQDRFESVGDFRLAIHQCMVEIQSEGRGGSLRKGSQGSMRHFANRSWSQTVAAGALGMLLGCVLFGVLSSRSRPSKSTAGSDVARADAAKSGGKDGSKGATSLEQPEQERIEAMEATLVDFIAKELVQNADGNSPSSVSTEPLLSSVSTLGPSSQLGLIARVSDAASPINMYELLNQVGKSREVGREFAKLPEKVQSDVLDACIHWGRAGFGLRLVPGLPTATSSDGSDLRSAFLEGLEQPGKRASQLVRLFLLAGNPVQAFEWTKIPSMANAVSEHGELWSGEAAYRIGWHEGTQNVVQRLLPKSDEFDGERSVQLACLRALLSPSDAGDFLKPWVQVADAGRFNEAVLQATALNVLAEVLEAQGNESEAVPVLERTISLLSRSGAESHGLAIAAQQRLVRIRVEAGEVAAAKSVCDSAARTIVESNEQATVLAHRIFVQQLHDCREDSELQGILAECRSYAKVCEDDPYLLRHFLDADFRAQVVASEWLAAEDCQRSLFKLEEELFGSASWLTQRAVAGLAWAELESGDPAGKPRLVEVANSVQMLSSKAEREPALAFLEPVVSGLTHSALPYYRCIQLYLLHRDNSNEDQATMVRHVAATLQDPHPSVAEAILGRLKDLESEASH